MTAAASNVPANSAISAESKVESEKIDKTEEPTESKDESEKSTDVEAESEDPDEAKE